MAVASPAGSMCVSIQMWTAERKGTGSEAKLREAVPSTGVMVLPSSPHTTPAVRAMAASPAVPTGMPAGGKGWRGTHPIVNTWQHA